MSVFFAALLFLAQVAAPPPPAQNATPTKPTVQPSPDPASVHFLADTGLLLVFIKPAAVVDYEQVLRAVQGALAKDADSMRSKAAKGWRVYKASENDAKGNAVYIHLMLPAVTGFDYRPSLLLDELVKDLAPELLSKYQEAFAGPPSKLNLTELANMSIAPAPVVAPPPDASAPIKKPGQ